MPRRIQLPNGRWVTVPDMDPYVQQIMDRRRGLEEEEEDEGTLAGSAWEGIKSIPSGVADIFYSGLQASIGVATPFADLPVERRLREQASKRARERDPAYQDAFLPAVGTGVGQVAGLSAISRLPYGWHAAVGAGVAMGISDQTRRIADYEQKTGTDVPWYNESAAHLAGALIGLSEVVPIKFGMFPASVSKMMTRMKGGVTPNAGGRMSLLEKKYGLGAAASMAMQEATQEASAQWLQSVTARGLYDPDAMQDLAHSMAEDFKVGGAVGGLVKLVQHQMLNPRLRTADRDLAAEGSLRSSRGRNYALARELDDNITGITRELPELLTNVGVNPILARDISEQFGGITAAIPRGMDTILKSGSITQSDVRQLVVELQTRTDRAKSELDRLIQHRPASRQEYEKAKAALDVMTADRIKNLSRTTTELRGGLGDMGGLTGNEQYQEARQADLESDTGATRETVMGVYETRRQARLNPDDPKTKGVWASFKSAIRSLMGGSFGIGGFYQMAEDLGVRRGPGSEKINLGVDPNLALSDMGLASSDRSSFDAAELGGVIFGGRGDHSSSTPQRKVDNSDVMDNLVFPDIMLEATRGPTGVQLVGVRAQLKALEERKAKLEKQIDNLYEKHPFTREMDEIAEERKHADDESWVQYRDLSQEFLLKQTQMVKANISQLNRERNDIYLRLLNQRLQQAQDYFAIKGNLGYKQSAAKRVLGKADVRAFDTWLNGTIASVNQSQINGQNMAQLAADQRAKFEAGLAAETDISKDAKAALTVKFLSQNAQEFGTQPRDISARQFMQVANLFGADSKVVKARAQGAFALKALSDIARWQVDDRLYDVTVDGLPDINESAPVVKQFLSKLEGLVTDKKTGKVSLEEGKPGYISDGDIVELLRSKNIYLRDETRIGESLAKKTKTGVKSKPFEKLLLDMTGALSWEKATYSQRLLMYSRLLQLPAHYTARGNPEEQRFLEGKGELDYRPLFLPDFYNDPSIDSHTDFMIDEVANITDQGHHKWPSRAIGTLKNRTQTALGKEFDSESFYEALARLIETGVFNPTDSAAPDVIISPDSWLYAAPTDESQLELGQDAGGLGDPIAEVPTRAAQKKEYESREGERQASAVSNSRVRLNVEYKALEDPWAPTSEGMTQPGDTRAQDEAFWVRESKPQLVNRLLTDPDAMWAGQVDELWARYNEKNTGKPISREDFVKRFTALITSTSMLQELSDMEVLDTVRGVVARGKTAPTEDLLELGTAEGRSLVQSLIKAGALPSSLQDDIHARRRRYVDTMTKRFEILDAKVEEVFKSTRLPDNIQRQYVDDLDGLYQFHRDVAIGGKRMEGVRALYDAPGNRIIINLALVDPNDMASAQEVVKDAAFHEGLHALIMRDHLLDEELKTLRNFVRNQQNIVPKEVDPDAHDAKVTWFERAIAQHKDSQLTEGDIENEAIISLLQNMVRNPDAYVAGKKTRKIGDDLRGFLEKFVGAAKDADIVDVMRILGRIERGEVGERGSGFGFIDGEEYTDDSIIRSNMLLRYANPADIKELRKAIVLRDAAPSDGMRQSEQAKVDAIADRITNRREIIQGSAGPPPSAVTSVEDERILHEHINATARGSQPLLALRYGKKDPEAYKLALNTFIETRNKDPEYAYRMPAEYQTLFDNKGDLDQPGDDTRKRWIDAGWVTPIDADATRKSVKKLSDLDNKTGDTVEETESNFDKTVENLRYLYLDRRQWVVKQTDRLLAAQNRAELDAETSALVMWRNSDNALNWLPGLMLRGPLSYLGTSVGSGRFENAPVYDNDLAEKFGGDGRIGGLNEIFAPIIDSKDQELATIYGAAKRILWTKKRRDALRSATGQYGPLGDRTYDRSDLDPSTRLKLEKFEAAYVAINENDRISEDELNQTIRDVEEGNPHIVEFWDRYNAYDNHMIKMSYNTGMITREVRDEWMAMPYAPFYRDVATEEDFPVGSRQEIAKRGKNLVEKALKGSTGPIKTSLADGIIQNTQALVRDAMMNAAVSRTVRDAVSLGEARKIKISALEGVLDNRVVRVMEEGVPVFYELDDVRLAMSTMLLGYNPKKQLQELFGEHKAGELTQKLLTGSSELLREAVTRTPPFALKNVFRDSWNAMSLTGGGPKLVLQAFKNAFDVDILRRADEAGLSIGVDFVAEPGRFGEKMKKELDKANLDWKNPRSPFAALWNFTGRIAKQSEVSTRLAVYDRVLAMTGNKSLAQYYAIEIMNYGRRGSSATLSTWMSTVPFMNGRMQGLDVTYRGLRGKKGSSDIPGIAGYGLTADQYEDLPAWQKSTGSVLGRGLILTAATGALYLLMRDDEEWQDLRDETKSDNWVLPLSDHAWLKIPIPFEIGVIFKVIPEKILEAIFEKDVGAVDVGEEAYRQLRTSLSIGGPQLFAPVVNAMRNYDTFRKDDIVDHWMEETLSPNEQRNSYTSNVARGMADLANSIPLVKNLDFLTSPMKVEYMMRQYGGTMGGYVITVADRIARTGPLADESVVGTNKDFDFRSMVGGEGVANVPILGDLLTDPRGRGGRQQEFYEALEELDLVVATLRSITERDHQRGFTYAEKHAGLLENQSQLRSIGRQLKEWREDRDYLAEIPRSSMSDDRKRESYKRLLEDRQYILRDIDALMESINRR